ncbi:hypothetical protein V6N12_043398 [Hibiscus sabdariffa]|uniref:Uncharacterized protein n=1 Tax=Hibiscus sabdariffa TaxID=183260 RepID=A0ABR2DE98_9ROSI
MTKSQKGLLTVPHDTKSNIGLWSKEKINVALSKGESALSIVVAVAILVLNVVRVIKWRTEVLIEGSPEDEIDALISESLMSLVKFKPASKLVEGLSSRKAYAVCSDAFSDGDEVASMPCHHVYHYNSVVLVELISNAIE